MVYANFKKKLISDFETRRDLMVVRDNQDRLESLFGIKDKNDRLYMHILNAFEATAIQNVEDLVIGLCETKGIYYYMNPMLANYYDIEIEFDGIKKHVEFKSRPDSLNTHSSGNLAEKIKKDDAPALIVFLVKDGIYSREATVSFELKLKKMGAVDVQCMLFEDFLEVLFGEQEKLAFQEEMADFKEEMHKAIGYQITELCSPYNLEKLKQQLEEEIKNYDYDRIKQQRYADMLAAGLHENDLYNSSFSKIKNTFIGNERYKLLLGNSDFAESFITSEWLYKKYFALDELDNTFIVAGYLKSIEQLLWDIIFMVGQGRKIKEVEISEANQDTIDKTLGALQRFLNDWSNDDLFQNTFGGGKHVVMRYLKNQISDWRQQYRNGYFHKHNLKDKEKIDAIREETYFLYLLILGTVKLSGAQILRLA
jgi:hypothetical protein